MHDERINCIVFNAFNGFGDVAGSDDFGFSVAWIDLDDYLDPTGLWNPSLYPCSDDVSVYVKSHPDTRGLRWQLAFIEASGNRYVVPYRTKEEMIRAFREYEHDYTNWEIDECSKCGKTEAEHDYGKQGHPYEDE